MPESGDAAVMVERGLLQSRQRGLALAAMSVAVACSAAIAAGAVSASVLAGWVALSAAVMLLQHRASKLITGANATQASAIDRLQHFSAALGGLVAGAAGTLFLPLLDPPARIALTILACSGLCAAIVDFGHHGRPFRLQLACCIGQFALAWWRLGDPGSELVAAALVGFWLLAGFASTGVDRLGRQFIATALENRRLADSLAVEHARALAADRDKTRFIAAASHDLRQPAAALSLMTGLLRQQVSDPALAPTVNGLERSVQAMNELLGQLLDLSRLDAGRISVETCRVDVDDLLDDLAREVAPLAAERGLAVQVRHCGHELDCDPLLVGRMLRNLVHNALRHTASGGITLGARVDDRLSLTVADTGAGIAQEHHARIFEEHFQVGNESRQRAQGLGLGLAIVRRIAALHEVQIDLASAPGAGSVFTLRFRSAAHRPLKRNAPPACPTPAPSSPAPDAGGDAADSGSSRPFSGRRILLIEDDELLATAFLAWLRAAGFQARLASDGAEAVKALRAADTLDVVVSDFRLPGELDGLALLGLAGERHPGVCRVLVSGDIDPALAERAADCGVALLRKPVDPSVLQRLLSTALG